MISTNQFKNGAHIEVDGTVFRIVEFQHVKPGKGGAFVRTKLKRVADGAVLASLADTLMPEAFEHGRPLNSFAAAAGFFLSFILAA